MKIRIGYLAVSVVMVVVFLAKALITVPHLTHGKDIQPGFEVNFAEGETEVSELVTINDPYFPNAWSMAAIRAPQAWETARGSASIKIAILDTGIDQDHEDLASKIVANVNFTTSDTVDDRRGHGTHVAGIAAAAAGNATGIAGVGFDSSLMNVKVLGDNGRGRSSWTARGIVWAADNGANVINLSLGSARFSELTSNAISYAWKRGVIVVAAAGNNASAGLFYPAGYEHVIAVAATDTNDARASFTNYGTWIEVAAPGRGVYSTLPNHPTISGSKGYGNKSGTSMASAHVAGLAALVKAKYPGMTGAAIRDKILVSTDPASGFAGSIGRINAFKAVN
ncbi:MAG: S8 family serine peptidase [Chloroflexi bacterium]|nr:S8 family serine peptidase [Chloroflexota bacterium]